MKTLVSVLVLLGILYAGSRSSAKYLRLPVPANAVKGDFNGDGKPDYAWLVPPKLNKDGESCAGSCDALILFSDTRIKPIKIANCIGGKPNNLGDLNNDGKDEIGLLPEWFTSCWRGYLVYTLKQSAWEYAVPPISTHCNQWENNVKPIEKDPAKKGYVIIHYSDFDHDQIVTKTKSEAIK